MDQAEEYISEINTHSFIHLAISSVSAILVVVLILTFTHVPLIITLLVISAITLVSGFFGQKITRDTEKRGVTFYFIMHIILLAAWDFGGIVCVITIIFGTIHKTIAVIILVSLSSCIIYTVTFIYFWKSFIVVNRLITLISKRRNRLSKETIKNKHSVHEELIADRLVARTRTKITEKTTEDRTFSVNTGSITS